jgi:transcriptional regulator with XRE-family HTH domain
MINNRDTKILKSFGKNLKKARLAKGMSTRQFADTADIAHSQLWMLETGQSNPSLTTLIAISRVLEVSIDDLIA